MQAREAPTLARCKASVGSAPPSSAAVRMPQKASPAPVVSTGLIFSGAAVQSAPPNSAISARRAQRHDAGDAAGARQIAGETGRGTGGKAEAIRDIRASCSFTTSTSSSFRMSGGTSAAGATLSTVREPRLVGTPDQCPVLLRRDFHLHQDGGARPEFRIGDPVGRRRQIGAAGDGDEVLRVSVDADHGAAGRLLDQMDARGIDAGAHEGFDQSGAEGVGTDASGHGDGSAGAGGGNGLIVAFAARFQRIAGTQDRLPGFRQNRDRHQEVHVE